VTVELPYLGRSLDVAFTAHEVKTLRIPADVESGATEVDLLEWDPAAAPPFASE
jgi:alpha-mannosidase